MKHRNEIFCLDTFISLHSFRFKKHCMLVLTSDCLHQRDIKSENSISKMRSRWSLSGFPLNLNDQLMDLIARKSLCVFVPRRQWYFFGRASSTNAQGHSQAQEIRQAPLLACPISSQESPPSSTRPSPSRIVRCTTVSHSEPIRSSLALHS